MPEKKKGNRARLPREVRALLRLGAQEFVADPQAFELLATWSDLDDRCARLHAEATPFVHRAAALRALDAARLRKRRPAEAVRRVHREVMDGRLKKSEELGLDALSWLHDVVQLFRTLKEGGRCTEAALRLLSVVAERGSILQSRDSEAREALWNILTAETEWVRPPEEWRRRRRGVAAQVESLAAHLFARYRMPACFAGVWAGEQPLERAWYRHLGKGGSIRSAPGLPFPLSKRAVPHVLRAPRALRPTQALRYGQVRALGGSELQARALASTRLGCRPNGHEDFWLTFVRWVIRHPELPLGELDNIVFWLNWRRHPPRPDAGGVREPNLSMRGRSPASLLRDVQAWEEALGADEEEEAPSSWPEREDCAEWRHAVASDEDELEYSIASLNTAKALQDEGRRMKHCVGGYVEDCLKGESTILSLRRTRLLLPGVRRLATLELEGKVLVEAKAKCNAEPSKEAWRMIELWCRERGFTVHESFSHR